MSPYRDAPTSTPDVLICSGLDPSGGAGFLADASVVRALGGRPVGVVTGLTVQNTKGMSIYHELGGDLLRDQLAALLSDIEVRAVKIGMIGPLPTSARPLADALALTSAPVVWDPVAAPTAGDLWERELFEAALQAHLSELTRHLTLITPNRRELGLLVGTEPSSLAAATAAAEQLASTTKAAVLIKGGHFEGDDAIDILVEGGTVEHLRGARIVGDDVHGTGCALSSAIAAHLAHGRPLLEACRLAKAYVAQRIAAPVRPGRGAPAII